MEKIAVTGYTGFIGRHLVPELIKQGHTVYPIGRDYRQIECDRIYHLACPSTTAKIYADPLDIMDTIMDGTRRALAINSAAMFINASTMGVNDLVSTPQGCYNIAKLCMETYVTHSRPNSKNYRIPAVYGIGMNDDMFIKRCIDGKAYKPTEPNKEYYIAHISEVVNALVELRDISMENTTLGEIYKRFSND